MSNEHENLAEFGRWFEEVWNKKQPEKIVEFAAPNVITHGLGRGGSDLHGPEAFREVFDLFACAFPDLQITLGHSLASGDTVASVLYCSGTHRGLFIDRPATGKSVSFTAMAMARYEDGLVVEAWNVVDVASIMSQIGQ